MSQHLGRFVFILMTASLAPAVATAQSGSWAANTAGTYNWSLSGNWQSGTVADGANNTATFATTGLTGNITVTLDTQRTIGSLVFDNPTNTFGWTVTGGNSLTLSNSASGGPTIAVNNGSITATIASPLAGTQGFTKTGAGTLSLTGTNTYSGTTTISDGTLSVSGEASLGAGPVSFSALGTLLYSATTTTGRTFSLGGGEMDAAPGAVVTLNGGTVSGGFVGGSGTFSTDPTNGAQFANMTIAASATIVSNAATDRFVNVNHSGPLNVAPGVNANGASTTVNLSGFTNQGGGTVTIGAGSQVNVSDFETFGVVNLDGANIGSGQMTLIKNVGGMPLEFASGSRTFLARVPAAGPSTLNTVAGIDLNGQNAVISGALLVNDGFITDSSAAGSGTVMVAGLLKGSGTYHVSVVTNGGQFQAGDSIGAATFDRFTFGPGGVSNYLFAISNATGTAGPSPDANGHVSGWGLVKVTGQSPAGSFSWTAGTGGNLTVALETLVNPTTVGTGMDSGAALANFDPTKSYSWTAVTWTGAYTGPTDPAILDAATVFNTGMFASPIAGTFGWSLDTAGKTLSLIYTPTAIPEPGTFALLAMVAGVWLVRRRRRAARLAILFAVLLGGSCGPAVAGQTGAMTSGGWSAVATWTNGVPAATDDAYIGSTSPSGAAATATVTLSQNSSAANVYLGNGSGTKGTLDLNGFALSATNLYLGENGGTGSISRTGGGVLSISSTIFQNSGALSLAPGDVTYGLNVSNGSAATTSAVGNVTGTVEIDAGSTLTLGANLSLNPNQTFPAGLDVRGTLDAAGHAIAAANANVSLGYYGGPFTLSNRGPITANTLNISSQFSPSQTTLNLMATDSIRSLSTFGISTTFQTGASVAGLLLLSNGASPPTYSTASTSAGGNITDTAYVYPGCTLTLGANLTLANSLELMGTLNANGHAISAAFDVVLGYNDGPFTLTNRGPITAHNLYVSSSFSPAQTAFNLTAADAVTNFNLYGVGTTFPPTAKVQTLNLYASSAASPTYSTATTAGTGNVTNSAYVDPGNLLTLGANLSLSGTLDLRGTLNANGYAVSASTISVAYFQGPAFYQNDGLVTASIWQQGSATHIRLRQPGDVLGTLLLKQGAILTIADANGQMTGLTISGMPVSSLSIDATSDLMMEVNGLASGWVFRWANPGGGDHIADLQGLINSGEITFASLNGGGYALTADSAYTYVSVTGVPEPSSLALIAAVGGLGLIRGVRRRRFARPPKPRNR